MTRLLKLISLIFFYAAITLVAGCATDQNLRRTYGVLSDKLDVSQKDLSSILERRLEETRQTILAETAALSREMQNLKAQSQLDIEINRREIQAAATRAELKRVEEGTLQLAESLEKKIMSALDGRVLALKNEAGDDRIKQAALANQIGELTAELKKYRADMEKSSFQISSELQRSKETFIADLKKAQAEIDAARQDIEKNIAQTERSRREIQLAGQELEKHKAEITQLRGGIEVGRLELNQNRLEIEKNITETKKNRDDMSLAALEIAKGKAEIERLREAIDAARLELGQNRLEIEKNITETEKNKTEIQLAALGLSSSRAELERIKNEIDKDRLEIKNLAAELEANRTLLAENQLQIEKGQTDIAKVGSEMMLSKSVGADLVADMTDLRDKLRQLEGSLGSFQRNQAASHKELQTLQDVIKGMIEAGKMAADEHLATTEKLNKLSKNMEFLTRYLDLDKKEPPATTASQAIVATTDKEPASRAGTTEPAPLELLYERAYDAFKEGKYGRARAEFQELLKRFPRGELPENAQFWIAESFFFEKQYERAIVEYEKTLQDHAGGNRAPQALFRQGLSFLELGDKTQARLYFEKVLQDFPHSTQARMARSRLSEMKN